MDPRSMDTPEMRRAQLAEQREEAQKRLEARRDAVIAAKKLESSAPKQASAPKLDQQLIVKNTTQNLVSAMKTWVKLPKSDASPDDVSVCEKEIANLTVKLSGMAPDKDVKTRFVSHIKQLLLRGKLAIQDPTDANMGDLTTALKDVAEDLKEFVTGATPNSPAPLRPAMPAHVLGSVARTASSPALVKAAMPRDRDSLSNPTLPAGGSIAAAAAASGERSAFTGSSSSVPVLPVPASPAPAATAAVAPLDAYDDGSPAPPPSQDIATSMWEQADKFPKLEVPWVLDYLAMQVLLRQAAGGGGSAFDAMLGEKKLAPYDITYAPGNVSWIIDKDPLIPLSLLKRYLWHLPSSIIPDRQEALDLVKEGSIEVVSYVMSMPLHKRDVLGYIVSYIRRIVEMRPANQKDAADITKVFAPLVFRSSSNYNSRDNKMKIPKPLDDEVKFLHVLVRDLDTDMLSKKGARERSRLRTGLRGSGVYSSPSQIDFAALRTQLRGWSTENELSKANWEPPLCAGCNERATNWSITECKKCGQALNRAKSAAATQPMKFLSGFQYELGHNVTSNALRALPNPQLECPHTVTSWYQDFFYGKPHINIVVQDSKRENRNVAVVSVLRPPDGVTDQAYPARALVLDENEGYLRIVVDIPPAKKKVLDPRDVVAAVKAHPQLFPQDAKFIYADNPKLADALADFEAKSISLNFKFGVLYLGPGQSTEEHMYNNLSGSAAYDAFLELIGNKVTLAKHTGFRGGLECRGDNSTGEFSVHTRVVCSADGALQTEEGPESFAMEIMWHVATYLPFDPENVQQLHRKRHLGNDLVIVVFSESLEAFDATTFASQFNHVWIVVSPVRVRRGGAAEAYNVNVCTKTGVKAFRPFLPDPPVMAHGPAFRDWFLLKCINAEKAAMFAKDFRLKETRTRSKMFDHWEGAYLEAAPSAGPSWGASLVDKITTSSTSLLNLMASGVTSVTGGGSNNSNNE